MGKRLYAERLQYLVLCWMHPLESEPSDSDLDHRFREYDEKISRDLAQQERPSTLRSRKRQRTHSIASASQNSTYPSRQVVEDLFLDVDVRSVDLNPI